MERAALTAAMTAQKTVRIQIAPAASRTRALEMQRARILDAMVRVVRRRGYAHTSVTLVSAQAKVSHHTFEAVFDGLEDCFMAVLDEGARRAGAVISNAFERERSWPDGVRAALAALLVLFESEQELAHVLLVEASAAGPRARERRERHLATLTEMIEQRWWLPEHGRLRPLASAGALASLLGVLHTRLVTDPEGPLVVLLGPMMGLVTAPYLPPHAVRREIERGEQLARELLAERDSPPKPDPRDDDVSLPDLLRDPRAHRARACLRYLAQHPGASNRQIATGIGIAQHPQISALLARLGGAGLLDKLAGAPGRSNAWSLSARGRRAAHALSDDSGTTPSAYV